MKNIHILPTDKPSRLFTYKDESYLYYIKKDIDSKSKNENCKNQNIYITSDEEIKEGDWIFDIVTKKNEIAKFNHNDLKRDWKKIILTTDQDLIKDGVQAIDDEFLEWFVKNPSCEEVDVDKLLQTRWGTEWHDLPNQREGRELDGIYRNIYKIIIPKEEPKNICIQTGLPCGMQCFSEKACNMIKPKQETLQEVAERYSANELSQLGFINGAKWQEHQTIEEVFEWLTTNNYLTDLKETLIENFKNK